MLLEIIKKELGDVKVIKPRIFKDDRGCFFETYNKVDFKKIGIDAEFIQDNQSISNKNVLRGLHFQNPPFEQGKLIRVTRGAVLDVVVDIRKHSEYYGKYFSLELSEENNLILWVPPGFAHGFLTLEDNTMFLYKCTQIYNKDSEGAIVWNDEELKINWNITDPIISDKDKVAQNFKKFETAFNF